MNSAAHLRLQRSVDRQNLHLLVQLRWLAVIGQVLAISVAHHIPGVLLPLPAMALVLLALVLTNLGYIGWWRSHRRPLQPQHLFAALLLDVLALALQLYWSGGAGNPFVFLFLLQGILGAVMLRARHVWGLVAVICLCALLLAFWHQPLQVSRQMHVAGTCTSLALAIILLTVFLRRIVTNLRRRDARQAAMRQRASEQEHMARMGLLATGAAHELGTPLATLSVILGDWQHDLARLPPDMRAQMQEQVQDMQQQLLRCKDIVSGVLMSAGEARADAPRSMHLSGFVLEVVRHWRTRHPVQHFDWALDGPDIAMLSDMALGQMLGNVLDNAAEASPGHVRLHVCVRDGVVSFLVRDRGPGFAPQLLRALARPIPAAGLSSKTGRAGPAGMPGRQRGLGLFLACKVAQSLGGSLRPGNAPAGGAEVHIRLPLAAIALHLPDAAPSPAGLHPAISRPAPPAAAGGG